MADKGFTDVQFQTLLNNLRKEFVDKYCEVCEVAHIDVNFKSFPCEAKADEGQMEFDDKLNGDKNDKNT